MGGTIDNSPLSRSFVLVKIGVADTNKVIEFEVASPEEVKTMLDDAFTVGQSMLWLTDTKNRLVGLPLDRVAYVEVDEASGSRSVGFARASG